MNKKYILGADPGVSGAFCLLNKDTQRLIAYPIPTTKIKGKTALDGVSLAAWLDTHRNLIDFGYVEQVTSRPRQAGQFQFGINTGVIHGMLWANAIPWKLVPPNQWKFWFNIKRDDTQTYRDMKNHSRALASEQWPEQADLFKRIKDDGVAEAALIALYGLNTGEVK